MFISGFRSPLAQSHQDTIRVLPFILLISHENAMSGKGICIKLIHVRKNILTIDSFYGIRGFISLEASPTHSSLENGKKEMGNYVESHLIRDEAVVYAARLHWVIYLKPKAFLSLWIGPFIQRTTSEFAITNKRIIIKVVPYVVSFPNYTI